MNSTGGKLLIALGIVLLYLTVPLLSAIPAAAPAAFHERLAGVPVSFWFVVVLLAAFPLIAWLTAAAAGGRETGTGEDQD